MRDRAAARVERRARKLDPRGAAARSVRPPALGVDVGGVLVDLAGHDSDTSFFGSRPMDTPVVPGAVEALSALSSETFGGRVYVVSKAGPRVEALTRAWLQHIGFHERTAVGQAALHFVRTRPDKAPVCERLGITHFIDDRLDVLNVLSTVSHRLLFTGALGHRSAPQTVPPGVPRVSSWPEAAAALRATVAT